jgi:predicted alpha/beta superfamily hydrolase
MITNSNIKHNNMKKYICLFIILFLIVYQIKAQKDNRFFELTFHITSPSLPDDSSLYICGNLPQLGNWNPSAVKMKNSGNHTWSLKIKTDVTFPIEYKYTLGSWLREGAEANGRPFSNFTVKAGCDTVINDVVLFWLNGIKKEIAGKITGTVKYHTGLRNNDVPDHQIIVWLPPDYGKNSHKRYPVLYMQDGQNLFDPATSAFGVDWKIDETCDSLIRNKIIDPLIVVGIYNTSERMTEYTPGQKGTAYMKFVVNTVKPFIDKNYVTYASREYTFAGGSSAGGTISFMLAWNYPNVFSKAICMSPAFKIMNIDLVKEISDYSGLKKDLVFYFDIGGKGLEERLRPGIDEMIKALEDIGYIKNKDIFWFSIPEAVHNETAWAKRMPEALKIIMQMDK